jgi:fucose 4-O-acetylase-like acetyltransferase
MRGLAMTAVVLGHAIQRNLDATEPAFLFFAAFEMQLFAFVSGYLTRLPSGSPLPWFSRRAQRLLIPFVVWAPILWFMSRFDFTGLNVAEIPQSLGVYLSMLFVHPADGLWYLLVLFYWATLVLIVSRLLSSARAAIAIGSGSVAALMVVVVVWQFGGGFTLSGDFGLRSLIKLLPFFVGGFVLPRLNRNLDEPLPPKLASVSFLMLAGLAASLVIPAPIMPLLHSTVLDLGRGVLGVVAFVLLIRAVPSVWWIRPLAYVGRASLGVYALHLLFLRAGFGYCWTKTLTSFSLALALSLIGTYLARRNRLTAQLLLGERHGVGPGDGRC